MQVCGVLAFYKPLPLLLGYKRTCTDLVIEEKVKQENLMELKVFFIYVSHKNLDGDL